MYIQYNKISVSVYFPKLVSRTVILTDVIYRNLSNIVSLLRLVVTEVLYKRNYTAGY